MWSALGLGDAAKTCLRSLSRVLCSIVDVTLREGTFSRTPVNDGGKKVSSLVASSTAATAIDPDQDLHGCAPPFRSDLCAVGVREGYSYYFGLCFHTSFEPLRSPRAPAGRKPTRLAGDRKFASDPWNRYPRSLAALETTELLLGVKQVGSSRRAFVDGITLAVDVEEGGRSVPQR